MSATSYPVTATSDRSSPATPADELPVAPKPRSGGQLVRDLCRPYRGQLAWAALLFSAGTALRVAPFLALYLIIREAFTVTPDTGYMILAALGGLLGVTLRFVLVAWGNRVSHHVAFRLERELRAALVAKLGRLPLGFFSQRSIGDIKKAVQEDVAATHGLIAHSINDVTSGVVAPLAIAVFLFVVDWRMALVSFALVPLAFLAHGLYMAREVKRSYDYWEHVQAEVSGAVTDFVNGMIVAKAFNQSARYFGRFREAADEMDRFAIASTRGFRWPGMLSDVLLSSNAVVVLPVGGWLHLRHGLPLADLLLFLLVGMALTSTMLRMTRVGFMTLRTITSIGRAAALLDAEELREPATPRTPVDSTLAFERVSFTYDPTVATTAAANDSAAGGGSDDSAEELDRLTVTDISFSCPTGTITALVGPSGAGKTTLARLIPRFADVSSGRVTLGGVDVRNLALDDLLSRVAVVFQDVFLLHGTVADNIRLGRADASDADVIAAAQAARAHDFISALPDGYQTLLGQRGARLSAGEKQRISIARAILKDAPVLILDEATASADPENEALIQDGLAHLAQGRTVLVIAHRLATIVDVHQIVVLDQGRIVDIGQHADLLERCVLYRTLWETQHLAAGWGVTDRPDDASAAALTSVAATATAAATATGSAGTQA